MDDAQEIRVRPATFIHASQTATIAATKAGALRPGTMPTALAGSPADAAATGIAATMSACSAALTTTLTAKGPELEAATQTGITHLQTQDERNAHQLYTIGQSEHAQWI